MASFTGPATDAVAAVTRPRIAVCLAAFDGARWLPEQLDSVLAQENVAVTVFVSVDRSTDGTESMVEAYAARDPRVVVLPHGERFGGAARNFFRLIRDVDLSGFDFVSLADQDDIWAPAKLARACEVLERTVSDAYSSDVMAFWPSGRQALIRKSQPQREWDFLFEAAGPGCTYVLRMELALAVQELVRQRWEPIQEVAFHDWLIYAFARARGYRWVIDERVGMRYRQHERNEVGVNTDWRAFLFRSRKVLSTFGPGQAGLIAHLVGCDEHPAVTKGLRAGRRGLLWLAGHAGRCRRRLRDRIVFALACGGLCLVKAGRS
ncbi:MAG: glycosyltransferase [Vicinamibacterales bacterium]